MSFILVIADRNLSFSRLSVDLRMFIHIWALKYLINQ